jgi:hypothetical protein
VQVTPDNQFLAGGFIRLGYIPATDRIVAAFGSPKIAGGSCPNSGHGYKEYTTDMQATGKAGVLNCGGGDSAELFVDNVLYDVTFHLVDGSEGWLITKYDAVTWTKMKELAYALEASKEAAGDMMIALVNGELDISGGTSSDGKPPPLEKGAATHHNFFTPDLQFLNKRTLSDIEHIVGSSMIFVDGEYYFVTANAYAGDVIMMKYDKDWKYLGMKMLIKQGHWSEGVAFDGQRFYVAYLDTSQPQRATFFPFYPNVHLAAFDRDWNLVEDVAVTNYTVADNVTTGRPWILLRGNHLYVAYDAAQRDASGQDNLDTIQAYVSVYELTQ